MNDDAIKVKFDNQSNPDSSFDIIKLEELFEREGMDHSIEELHRVEFFIILVITDGKGRHTIDFTDYTYKRGTILTVRKDQIQKFHKQKNVKGFLLLFTDDFLVTYLEKLEALKSIQLFNELLGLPKLELTDDEMDMAGNIISRIENEYFHQNDDHSLGVIRSELHILITKLFRIKSEHDILPDNKKYVSDFVHFQLLVEQNVNKTRRVIDYAKLMGVSTKTLNTISKRITDKSAKNFIAEISIKQIKRLLINTTLSVKEIAYASGFEESTNFYKYFKRVVGLTPEQFRASY